MKLPKVLNVTERQLAFIRHVVSGYHPEEAARLAGYRSPHEMAWAALRAPAVLSALEAELTRTLRGELAPLALSFCRKVLKDDGELFGETTRREVAKMVLDRAGFVPPRQTTAGASEEKDPEQMTAEELHATCARLEAELAGRARDVTPDGAQQGEDLADLLG